VFGLIPPLACPLEREIRTLKPFTGNER